MTIDLAQVEHVAKLARLRLDPQDATKMLHELSDILQYVERLSNLNTEGAAPTSHALDPDQNVLRADAVRPGLTRETALAAAPATEDGLFRVPRAVEV